MENAISIELEKQLYLAGEEVSGRVSLILSKPVKINNLYVILKGEEILGSRNFWFTVNVPILKEKVSLYQNKSEAENAQIKEGEYDFSFILPSFSPPSFKSANFGCQYTLTAEADLGIVKKASSATHITVVPNIMSYPKNSEKEFGISDDKILFKAFLEKEYFFINEIIKGSYYVEYPADNPPADITLELCALAQSLDKNYIFNEKIWSNKKKITIKPKDTSCVGDNFFFNLPEIVPFSGIWNTFKVYWRIDSTVTLADGETYMAYAYFDVYKFYDKFWEGKIHD